LTQHGPHPRSVTFKRPRGAGRSARAACAPLFSGSSRSTPCDRHCEARCPSWPRPSAASSGSRCASAAPTAPRPTAVSSSCRTCPTAIPNCARSPGGISPTRRGTCATPTSPPTRAVPRTGRCRRRCRTSSTTSASSRRSPCPTRARARASPRCCATCWPPATSRPPPPTIIRRGGSPATCCSACAAC
jgi:hypothetical protein